MRKHYKKILITSSVIAGFAVASASMLRAETQESFDAKQTLAIESIIQDYLMKNPKIVMDAAKAYQEQQEAEQQQLTQSAIEDNIGTLTSKDAPSIGPVDADITVVEFFDYNCGYCKRALPDIQAAVKADPKVRFVFKEMPILGPSSLTAAQWALAAQKQDKYFEFHRALMEFRGNKEESELAKIATNLGLDVEQMKKDAQSPEIQQLIKEDIDLAQKIGVTGTPAFIIGKSFYGGYLGEDGLMNAIKIEREKAKNDG